MKTISRILSVVLCLAMVIGFFTFGAAAADVQWTQKDLASIQSTDKVMITISYNGTYYALPNDFGSDSSPAGTALTAANNVLTADSDKYAWTFTKEGSSYAISPASDSTKYLYMTGNKTTVLSVGTTKQTWTPDSNLLKNDTYSRHLGLYQSGLDFRTYSGTSNFSGETMVFWVMDSGAEVCTHENTTKTYNHTYAAHWQVCECGASVGEAVAHDTTGENGACSACGYKADLSSTAGIMAAIEVLGSGEVIENVTLEGVISSIDSYYDPYYKNITVSMKVGDYETAIQCFRPVAAEGSNIDITALSIGDTIKITGNIENYQGTKIQFQKDSVISELTEGANHRPSDPAEIVAAAYALEGDKYLPYTAILTGVVTEITDDSRDTSYANITLIMVVGGDTEHPITVFRMKKGSAEVNDIVVGSQITVYGLIKNYVNSSNESTIEFDSGCKLGAVVNCAHENTSWAADDDSHWQVCGDCSAKLNECSGKLSWINTDASKHWQECGTEGCEYATEKADHNYTGDYIVGENGHYQKCVCLAEGTEVAHTDTDNNQKCDACNTNVDCNHSWVDQKDDTKHWEECEHCEEVRNEEDHTLTGNKNDTHHWTECECGHKTAEVAHTLTTEKNDTHHWSVCACGYKSAEVAHTLTNNKCECGYEKVEEGYFKVTDGVLTSGKYVLVASNGWAPTVLDGNWVLSAQPTVSGNEVTDPKGAVVTLTVDGNTVKITDANGKTIFNSDGGTKMTESDTAWNWKYEDGVFTFGTEANDEGKIRYLSSNSGSDCKFRAYYPATEADQWGNEYFHTFTLYKMSGTPSSGSGNTGSGDATPGNPEPPAEPFKPDTGVKEPTAGTAYKFGMYQENLGKYLYFAGSLNDAGYYLATTENYAEAVDVYVETTEGGYYLYFMNGETKTYIDLYVNGTYVNLRLVTEPGAVFAWNTEYQTFTTKLTLNDEELDYYMGTYKEYNTISGSKLSYAATSFPTHLYAEEPAPTGDNSVVSVAVAALIVSILGVTALVMKKKEF